jgi:hypothetical protein
MNDQCLLIRALTTNGPSPMPLRPCCTTALVALHDRDRTEASWLCPLEEEERETHLAGAS